MVLYSLFLEKLEASSYAELVNNVWPVPVEGVHGGSLRNLCQSRRAQGFHDPAPHRTDHDFWLVMFTLFGDGGDPRAQTPAMKRALDRVSLG